MLRLEEGPFGLTEIDQILPVDDVRQMRAIVYREVVVEGEEHAASKWALRIDDGDFGSRSLLKAYITDPAQAAQAAEWLMALLRARQ